MSPRIWLAALAAAAALSAFPSGALAGDADCSYIEIAATNGKAASIDGDLKPLEKKLKKPPFTAWNTFKKLSAGTSSLTKNKAEAIKLAQGAASLMLRDRSEKRVELTVTMDGADGKRVLDAKPAIKSGDWLLLVGTNAKDDGHILALTCK
jgi:hypothetical protein